MSTDNLVVLRGGGKAAQPEPHSGTVEMLRDMLAKAESGELQACIVVGVHVIEGEERIGTGVSAPPGSPVVLLLGGVEIARARALRLVDLP
jgi:hypothetical protein